MSFLEKEDEKPSSFWDWFIGIALVLAIGGFTVYYQLQKRASQKRFSAADTLYQQGDFRSASRLYEELKGAQYLTTANDSLIYARLDSVDEMADREKGAVNRVRSKLAVGDVAGARAEISATPFHGLLPDADQAFLDSVKTAQGLK